MSFTLTRPAAGLALIAALAAGCGTGVTVYHATRPGAAHHATPSPAAAARHHSPEHPIPQGNGGDQDSDNNGGPSDGDGNI